MRKIEGIPKEFCENCGSIVKLEPNYDDIHFDCDTGKKGIKLYKVCPNHKYFWDNHTNYELRDYFFIDQFPTPPKTETKNKIGLYSKLKYIFAGLILGSILSFIFNPPFVITIIGCVVVFYVFTHLL